MKSTSILFALFVAALGATWIAYAAQSPADPVDGYHLQRFALIPVQEGGRLMPFDTFARAKLLQLSHRQQVALEKTDKQLGTTSRTVPAHEWALDTMLLKHMKDSPAYEMHAFRIDNDRLLDLLELKPSPEFGYYFKLSNFIDKQAFWKRIDQIRAAGGPRKDDILENKVADLWHKIEIVHRLAGLDVPFLVPPRLQPGQRIDEEKWLSFSAADQNANAAAVAFLPINNALEAYAKGNVGKFNDSVESYLDWLAKEHPNLLSRNRTELHFNTFAPYYQCTALFVVVLILASLSWVVWSQPLRYAAWALGVVTILLYTWTLVIRVYLSGYAPVTNLYSSAIFIGWGCAGLCLVLELILRNGIGSVVAGVTGTAALIVAHNLLEGDSMTELVAVLRSNFWLSTHVICITWGYVATFVAGFLAIAYVLLGVFTPLLRRESGIVLAKVTYGVVCFAMFLSFVGTVLGGIWADESWGRFWGWDPKENGALLIVIWNALILHARWAGIVKTRGMMQLAILGNAVTGWSWFGTNFLGVGLHSYGFAQGGLFKVFVWGLVQLFFVAIAAIPLRHWRSFRPDPALGKLDIAQPAQ